MRPGWFRDPSRALPFYLQQSGTLPVGVVRLLLQVRTGPAWLRFNAGRHQGLPFDLRVCTRCSQRCVDDAMHVVFERLAFQHFHVRFC